MADCIITLIAECCLIAVAGVLMQTLASVFQLSTWSDQKEIVGRRQAPGPHTAEV